MTTERGCGRRLLSLGALVAAVAVAMVVLSPSRPQPTPGPGPTSTRLSAAEEYARAALDLMERHALYVDDASWPRVRQNTMAAVRPARRPAETYPALETALGAAAGPFGMLVPSADRARPPDLTEPVRVSRKDGVVWVTVPTVGEMGARGVSARASATADRIGSSRHEATCGWVIDLRDTRSAQDWGALAGLESFLREGPQFQWRDRHKTLFHVSVAMGSVFLDGRLMASVSQPGPRNSHPVAVLQSAETAGVGEALVAALSQSPTVRTFGETTRGTPVTEEFELSDGAALFLPTVELVGLGEQPLPQGIPPTDSTNAPERDATAWLRSQCRQR